MPDPDPDRQPDTQRAADRARADEARARDTLDVFRDTCRAIEEAGFIWSTALGQLGRALAADRAQRDADAAER